MSVGKPESKTLWWEGNIKMNLTEMRVETVYCIIVI